MFPELTERESEVLEQIAHGCTNKEISGNLSISESTVENHIHSIYIKLGITNRAQAVGYAFYLRILQPDDIIENRGNPS